MTTRAAQFEILAAGVQFNANLVSNPYVKFFAAGTDDAKTAWDDKDKSSAITKKALDTQGRAEVFGDGIYKLKFYTGDPDAEAPLTGVLLFEIDDYKVQASEFNVVNKTGAYTATPDDDVILCSGTWTLSLQTVVNFEHALDIVNIGSGTITVDPYSTQTIGGSSSVVLAAGQRMRIVPDIASSIWRRVDFSTDLNGTELIIDADGDTSIRADTDDRIDFKIGGTDKYQLDATSFKTDVIDEKTSASGVTVDGLKIQDSGFHIQGSGSAGPFLFKRIRFTGWNMDSTATFNVAHGISNGGDKIRLIQVVIYNDTTTSLSVPLDAGGYPSAVDSTNITLTRTASGVFDSAAYDDTNATRGDMLIGYLPNG